MARRHLHVAPGELSLPPDAVTSTLIVFGGKGMGKTNLGAVLVEELTEAGLRWCVLDPLGVWWGLRHAADGKGRGIECLILGGVHGDIPIEPTGGAVVADLVVDEAVDVVIDVSRKPSGQMWSKGERIRFVTDYAVRLFQRQGELLDGQRRPPLLQVLDEAARYIPQVVRAGDKDIARCVGAWEDLVEEGRNVGIGVALLTQRSARINKSVSELADAMFAFRTVGPLSLEAIMDWLGEHVAKDRIRELAERVRGLDVGSALVVSPGWLRFESVVRIRARETYDSSATPRPGETRRVTGAGAKPDLAQYQARMVETIERARAEDPRELRRRVAQLERDLARRPTEAVTETVVERVEIPVLNGEVGALQKAIADLRATAEPLYATWANVVDVVDRITSAIDRVAPIATPMRGRVEQAPRGVARPGLRARESGIGTAPSTAVAAPAPAAPSREPAPEEARALGRAERALLGVLAQFPDGRSKQQLSVLSGYSIRSSSFGNALGALRSAGLAEGRDPIVATAAGLAAASEVEPLPTGEALLHHWRGQLGRAERALLDVLVDAYPDALSRDELSHRSGYSATSSSFANALGKLRTLQLAEGYGETRAADVLFEGGR